MKKILYPYSGSPFDDAAILRNAVDFSTASRAHSAYLVLHQALGANQQELSYLAVEAFAEFMTSTEDMLGWLFVLENWQPGTAEFSLLLLLDEIAVGRQSNRKKIDCTEARAVSLLSDLDEQGFRELSHIPSHDDLIASGMSIEESERITHGMTAKLEGWRRIVNRRAEQDRGWVRAYNKLKHHLLAFPTQEHDKDEIFVPSRITFRKGENRILMEKAWLEVSSNQVRRWSGDAIAAQAVLHDTLALILVTRYGVKYSIPEWVVRAYRNDFLWSG